MSSIRKKFQGFTLLEILLVVGIISILAGIVIIAINPGRQLATVRNTERKSDIKQLKNAMEQYYIDHRRYPTSTPTTLTEVCDTGTDLYPTDAEACDDLGLIDLSILVPTYIVSIPVDPRGPLSFLETITPSAQALATQGAGYKIMKDRANKIVLYAPQAENSAFIAIGSTTATSSPATASYTITFDANGGTGSMATQTIDEGASENLTANSFTRSNYTFAGWATTAGGSVAYADGASYTMGGANVTLYAKWTQNLSSSKAITTFSITSATTTITEGDHTISVHVPYGTTVTSLTPIIVHSGASVSPNSGVAQDFTDPVTYTVTAEDSSTQDYVVTVTVDPQTEEQIVAALRTSLLVYWPMDGNANDNSGNGKNGSVSGASLVDGKVGSGAYSFNGSSNIGYGSTIIPYNDNSYTVSMWTKTSVNGFGYLFVQPAGDGWWQNHGIFFSSGGAIYGNHEYWGTQYMKYGTANYYDNNWHNIVWVRSDATTLQIYFDGVEINPISGTGGAYGSATLPSRSSLGADTLGGSYVYGYTGSIDEFTAWDRILTPTEIGQIYNSGTGRSLVQ
jgi:uncharacterized repeat protein (TIGR02543 family)/prepilin-type N-terminal cleavage/methylation domain-containing protein